MARSYTGLVIGGVILGGGFAVYQIMKRKCPAADPNGMFFTLCDLLSLSATAAVTLPAPAGSATSPPAPAPPAPPPASATPAPPNLPAIPITLPGPTGGGPSYGPVQQAVLNAAGGSGKMWDADQWNYFWTAATGVQQTTDLFPVGNRGALLSFDQYLAARKAAGLSGFGLGEFSLDLFVPPDTPVFSSWVPYSFIHGGM